MRSRTKPEILTVASLPDNLDYLHVPGIYIKIKLNTVSGTTAFKSLEYCAH